MCLSDLEDGTVYPDDPALQGQEEELVAIGRVVWCDREDDGFRVGICFTWLREQDRDSLKVIADYVQSRIGS